MLTDKLSVTCAMSKEAPPIFLSLACAASSCPTALVAELRDYCRWILSEGTPAGAPARRFLLPSWLKQGFAPKTSRNYANHAGHESTPRLAFLRILVFARARYLKKRPSRSCSVAFCCDLGHQAGGRPGDKICKNFTYAVSTKTNRHRLYHRDQGTGKRKSN